MPPNLEVIMPLTGRFVPSTGSRVQLFDPLPAFCFTVLWSGPAVLTALTASLPPLMLGPETTYYNHGKSVQSVTHRFVKNSHFEFTPDADEELTAGCRQCESACHSQSCP